MTDEPDTDAALADLEKTQKRGQRLYRRSTIINCAVFLALAALDAGLVVLGGETRWMLRDLGAIGGLAVVGMLGYVGAAKAYAVMVVQDAELLDSYRERAQLAQALGEVRAEIEPLINAIGDARARGVALIIQPADGPPPIEPEVLN